MLRKGLGVLSFIVALAAAAFAGALLFLMVSYRATAGERLLTTFASGIAIIAFIAAARLLRWRAKHVLIATGSATVFLLIAIPNVLAGFGGRSPQKRTMSDMRTIATAIEAYATDFNRYPDASSFPALIQQLAPTYVSNPTSIDDWGHPLRYERIRYAGGRDGYALGSAGKDGEWEKRALRDYSPATTDAMRADIVYSNGAFVQYPEGVQAN